MRAKDFRRINKGKSKKFRKMRQCWFCKQIIPPHLVSRDHIVPKALGGVTAKWNTRWACKPCNQAKGHQQDPLATRTLISSVGRRSRR